MNGRNFSVITLIKIVINLSLTICKERRFMIELGKYQHFKGNYYQVLHVAKCSETENLMVVYLPLYGKDPEVWVRPLSMFDETIERNGEKFKRFKKVLE